mgnify:FL=1
MAKVLLTGASGYIGGHLMEKLKDRHDIVAISRNASKKENEEHVTWKSADLMDLNDVTSVMEDIDVAIYLVHSMMPSSTLTQARFEDMDAILADNFARAAHIQHVKHIVFMSGIIPDNDNLSPHLESRLECERILRSYGTPVSTLRAALIIGAKGSSYPILKTLTEKLPILPLPYWTNNLIAPVYIGDVVDSLSKLVDRKPSESESIDITNGEIFSYKEMVKQTADALDTKIFMFPFPWVPIIITRYVAHKLTGQPKAMVYPLMGSLVHNMIPSRRHIVSGISHGETSYEDAVKLAKDEETKIKEQQKNSKGSSSKKLSSSDSNEPIKMMERVDIPKNWEAKDVVTQYVNFVNKKGKKLVHASANIDYLRFDFKTTDRPLVLNNDLNVSDENLVLYQALNDSREPYISLEFRKLKDSTDSIVTIEETEQAFPHISNNTARAKMYSKSLKKFQKHMDRYTEKQASKHRYSKSKTKSRKRRLAENLGVVAISAVFLGIIANDIRTSTNDARSHRPFS